MNGTNRGNDSPHRASVAPIVLGFFAFIVTAVAVSWATPDGNLVVTLVPALTIGFGVFRLALWRFRRGQRRQGA